MSGPFGLITLWMYANWAYRVYNALHSIRVTADLAKNERLAVIANEPVAMLTLEMIGDQILLVSKELELTATIMQTEFFLSDVNRFVQDQNQGEVARALEGIERVLIQEMMDICFESVPRDRTHIYGASFGPAVLEAFPATTRDIQEGNICFALGRYTACVFHMMRVAEIGLRALVTDRGVSFPKKPLNAAEWGEIIAQMESKIRGLRQLPANTWSSNDIRETQIAFYHHADMEFRALNEVWRRHVAHAHEGAFYDEGIAISAREHTEKLMVLLVTRISETKQGPEIWTS